MKKIFAFLVGASLSMGALAQSTLTFDANAGVKSSMTAYDGTNVNYTAYERLFYVTNVEDSTYQFLNVYVPEGATQQTPIFLRTYVGGYMASPAAQPQACDATGRALKEGYVVVIPGTRGRSSSIVADKAYAKELAAMFPDYLKSLNLHRPDGIPLTADNYLDFIKSELIRSAQIAKDAGADIPDSIGFTFSSSAGGMFAAPINGGQRPQMQGGHRPQGMRHMRGGRKQVGEYITDLDMQKYLNYVVTTQALKGVPAFDSQIEGVNNASGENEEFGNESGNSVNFTDFTAQKNGTNVSDAIRQNVKLMNPMSFIGDGMTSIAPHWYIRHGARDRDTAFPVPINFATKLQNAGKDVNFLLAWNRPHSGDYALDELFLWIAEITK